ncbi:MAG: hypothetical protein A2087_09725 [Spirochaetes bacterium GWD1_61_31]|nr:MAG: hypothetical protein A2Y37_10210 [Spirochaetes bacterium GWB1_60_80]OHD29045.1 MAG: hypothetical protein A2004_14430 [Spirochaetes bacterium GWC1_61_12]OHD35591.1 MAG: hypothetical protein A2087_09725 [Spirochaetes bacterium GWD1_61_31]OHD44212.1 MAG: hypothetical protein A2Y35_06635 [Spirochaetes bacterium GWE1_60_18]OHD60428.1 MAG: hypothetical protein A2Y32_00890 [Spirochaetes bacterium GWF1_60_12]HAP44468.1 hypothetical protein [Spirochaetaceae bacterium]
MPAETLTDCSRFFDHRCLDTMLAECLDWYEAWYGSFDRERLAAGITMTKDLFAGQFPGYAACNTDYHDWNHTGDVLVATIRLLDGYNLTSTPLPPALAADLCSAALLHDSGYIQEASDTNGTGAKYTRHHVARSTTFARQHGLAFGLTPSAAERVGRLIEVTDLQTKSLPGTDTQEASAAALLGSADLLGQMADRTYLEKLLFLYFEFREAGFPGYETEFDILRQTQRFYKSTQDRLAKFLLDSQHHAARHFHERYGTSGNPYLESITHQMAYLDAIIADDKTNFRKKLKRLDLGA